MVLVTTTLIFDHLLCNEAGKEPSNMLLQLQRGKPLIGMVQFFIRYNHFRYNHFGAGISLTGYWGLGIVVNLVLDIRYLP
jgi:hypothetical protein